MARRNIAEGPFSFELYSSAALATTAILSFPIDNGVNASLLCWRQTTPWSVATRTEDLTRSGGFETVTLSGKNRVASIPKLAAGHVAIALRSGLVWPQHSVQQW